MKKEYDVKIDWWGYDWHLAGLNFITGVIITVFYAYKITDILGPCCSGFDEAGRFIVGILIFGVSFFIPNLVGLLLNVIFGRRYVEIDVPITKRSRK